MKNSLILYIVFIISVNAFAHISESQQQLINNAQGKEKVDLLINASKEHINSESEYILRYAY